MQLHIKVEFGVPVYNNHYKKKTLLVLKKRLASSLPQLNEVTDLGCGNPGRQDMLNNSPNNSGKLLGSRFGEIKWALSKKKILIFAAYTFQLSKMTNISSVLYYIWHTNFLVEWEE